MASVSITSTAGVAFAGGSRSIRSLILRNVGSSDIYFAWRENVHATGGTAAQIGMLIKADEPLIIETSGMNLTAPLYAITSSGETSTLLVEPCHG